MRGETLVLEREAEKRERKRDFFRYMYACERDGLPGFILCFRRASASPTEFKNSASTTAYAAGFKQNVYSIVQLSRPGFHGPATPTPCIRSTYVASGSRLCMHACTRVCEYIVQLGLGEV